MTRKALARSVIGLLVATSAWTLVRPSQRLTSGDGTCGVPSAPWTAPLFSGKDKEGKQRSLKDYRGRFVLLCFVSTDKHSPFLLFDIRDLITTEELKARVQVVLVARAPLPWRDQVIPNSQDIPTVIDRKGEVFAAYRVRETPFCFLINPEGKMVRFNSGFSRPTGETRVRSWLRETNVEGVRTVFAPQVIRASGPETGRPAPEFMVMKHDGNLVSRDDFRGKPFIIVVVDDLNSDSDKVAEIINSELAAMRDALVVARDSTNAASHARPRDNAAEDYDFGNYIAERYLANREPPVAYLVGSDATVTKRYDIRQSLTGFIHEAKRDLTFIRNGQTKTKGGERDDEHTQ